MKHPYAQGRLGAEADPDQVGSAAAAVVEPSAQKRSKLSI